MKQQTLMYNQVIKRSAKLKARSAGAASSRPKTPV
jgi:hypothetical protein